MKEKYIETGVIANTHGIKGELKVVPWADGPSSLCAYRRFFIRGQEYTATSVRVHGTKVLIKLKGVDDINAAMAFKGEKLYLDREDIPLAPGQFLLADIIGAEVVNENGAYVGVLTDVLERPANDIYVVDAGEREIYIPVVDEFIIKTDVDAGVVTVRLIEGM